MSSRIPLEKTSGETKLPCDSLNHPRKPIINPLLPNSFFYKYYPDKPKMMCFVAVSYLAFFSFSFSSSFFMSFAAWSCEKTNKNNKAAGKDYNESKEVPFISHLDLSHEGIKRIILTVWTSSTSSTSSRLELLPCWRVFSWYIWEICAARLLLIILEISMAIKTFKISNATGSLERYVTKHAMPTNIFLNWRTYAFSSSKFARFDPIL